MAALNVLGLRLLGALSSSAQEPGSAPGSSSTLIVPPPLVALLICAVAAAASLEGPDKLIPELSVVAEELIDLVTARTGEPFHPLWLPYTSPRLSTTARVPLSPAASARRA